MVDWESQFQRKRRSLQWSRSPFMVPTVEAMLWCAMGMPPTGNRSLVVMPVGVAAASNRRPMPLEKPVARRSGMPLKSAAVGVASRAPLASLGPPCPLGSHKSRSASPLPHDPDPSRSRGSHVHDAGTGRTLVVCAQKSARLWDGDGPVPQDASSGGFCGWGSEQKDVSMLVGGHGRQLSYWSLPNVFLGSVSGGHPAGAAHRSGQRDRRNRPRGALESHLAAASGPFCPHDVVVFSVRGYARSLPASLSPSLEWRPGYPSQVSHYPPAKHSYDPNEPLTP